MRNSAPKKFTFFLLFIFFLKAYPQNSTIDSLQKGLSIEKEDSNRVNTLNELSYSYRNIQPDSGLHYGEQALALAEKLNWKSGIAKSYKCIGDNYYSLSDADKALDFFQKALAMNKQDGDKIEMVQSLNSIGKAYQLISDYPKALDAFSQASDLSVEIKYQPGIISGLSNLGTIYWNLADYQRALDFFLRTITLCEQTNNSEALAKALGNLGVLYTDLQNYPKALEYCKRALSIHEQLGNKRSIGIVLSSIGTVYYNSSDYARALEYYQKSMDIYEQTGDEFGIGQCISNIGGIYLNSSDYLKAIEYSQKSYTINQQLDDKSGMSVALYNMADIYNKADNSSLIKMGIMPGQRFSKVMEKLDSSLAIANEIGAVDLQRDALEALSTVYEKQKDYTKAYSTYKKYIILRDSIMNDDTKQNITRREIQYEYDKKETLLKAAQDKKDALAAVEITNQKIIRNISFALAILILAFSVYAFYRYKKKKQLQNQQALMSERLRISRELHDEVGATLSGIAMYSHLTKEQIKHANFQEVEKSVTVMQQSASEMVNKLSDIVWLVNPDQDSLQKLIQRLEEYARDMATIKNITVKVNAPENLHEHSLSMESRRNIYLFCKEAINNAVKYSSATLLELNIKEINNILEFSVRDNGKGFDIDNVKRGNGLENMQKRADEIGATLTLQSRQGEGSKVSMQLVIA